MSIVIIRSPHTEMSITSSLTHAGDCCRVSVARGPAAWPHLSVSEKWSPSVQDQCPCPRRMLPSSSPWPAAVSPCSPRPCSPSSHPSSTPPSPHRYNIPAVHFRADALLLGQFMIHVFLCHVWISNICNIIYSSIIIDCWQELRCRRGCNSYGR